MDKNNRPSGMSQLDWLWTHLSDLVITDDINSNEGVLTTEATKKLIQNSVAKNLINIQFRNSPEDQNKVQIVGTTVDGSTIYLDMPKENYVNSFKVRKITQEDIDSGLSYELDTKVLSIKLLNGQEYLINLNDIDTNYLVADTDTISLRIDSNNIITSNLKIDKGNNLNSVIQLQQTQNGVYANLVISSDDSGVSLTKKQSGLLARIPVKGSNDFIFFEDISLSDYMLLENPIRGHLYIINDKGYIFYNGRRYGLDLQEGKAAITNINYNPSTTELTIQYSDNRDTTNIILGIVNETYPGMMSPEMLETLNQTQQDLDTLEEKFEKRNQIEVQLINKNSGRPIGIRGHVGGPAVVEQQDFGFNDSVWIIEKFKGYYTVKNAATGLFLGIRYASTGINAVLSQDFENDSANLRWRIIPYSINNVVYYRFVNVNSNYTMEVEWNGSTWTPSTVAGAAIRQAEWIGGAQQLWFFKEVPQQESYKIIYASLEGDILRCVGIDASFQLNDAALVQSADYTNKVVPNNSCIWKQVYNEDGSFKLQNVQSGFYLCTYQDGVAAGTVLIQTSNINGLGTNFTYDGTYITEVHSGLVLGINGGNPNVGTNFIIWTKQEGDRNQTFYLEDYYNTDTIGISIYNHPYLPKESLGKANGVATLDENGKIPALQLNGHIARVQGVDEVIVSELPTESLTNGWMIWVTSTKQFNEWNGSSWDIINPAEDTIYNFRNSDASGNTDRTNILYRWDGSNLVEISESLAIGEVNGTAYEGSKGKANRESLNSIPTTIITGFDQVTTSENDVTLTFTNSNKDTSNNQYSDGNGNTIVLPSATSDTAGIFSSTDKSKLDSLAVSYEETSSTIESIQNEVNNIDANLNTLKDQVGVVDNLTTDNKVIVQAINEQETQINSILNRVSNIEDILTMKII